MFYNNFVFQVEETEEGTVEVRARDVEEAVVVEAEIARFGWINTVPRPGPISV